jgi:CRISPR-associated protein Cas5t
MKVLKVRFQGLTASFRIPFAIAGVQLSLPVPSYGTILGLISSCAGRNVLPNETRIGFEFTSDAKALDLERFVRWNYNPKSPGKPKLNDDGPAVRQREFLIHPVLDLYVSNLKLKDAFSVPVGIPTLGRSQDVAWISEIKEVELTAVKKGKIGGTLIPSSKFNGNATNGFLVRLPEYLIADENVRLRNPKNNEMFIMTSNEPGIRTNIALDADLYHPSDASDPEDCIYLHQWSSVN